MTFFFKVTDPPSEKVSDKWKPPKEEKRYLDENITRLQNYVIPENVKLSTLGYVIWELIKKELVQKNAFWIPKLGSTQQKHDQLFDTAMWLLNATPSEEDNEKGYRFTEDDLYIIVIKNLHPSINMLREKLGIKLWNPLGQRIGPKEEMLSKDNTRTPHSTYAKYEKQKGSSRSDAWNKLKQFAMESKGEKEVRIPGFGLIFLKLDRVDSKNKIRYKHSLFNNSNDGTVITRKKFNGAWDR